MPSTLRLKEKNLCGLSCWHPEWMQRYANAKWFMAVYSLLGTIQAMSYMYFVVTLTTIERRFKIPSQTTGIILSGNEISQIMLSLILSYVGGQRNRPAWIAWGMVFCGISCFILALPHLIYGAGEDAYHLTQEYLDSLDLGNTTSLLSVKSSIKDSQQLCGANPDDKECDQLFSIVPLVLIFLSQFVLGIGNTLYYSLGQPYLDDNTKKTNTPWMLAVAMSLRMIGPIFGFMLGYLSLNLFIDTSKTPLIDKKDPRWLGAWWFGWTILGTIMFLFSGLIGLFPKELPKKKDKQQYSSVLPQVLRTDELMVDDGVPMERRISSNAVLDNHSAPNADFPQLKDFPKALMRLLRNKLLIFNIIAGIFYILGASGYMTFLSKYMEVQFHRSAQNATIIVGPFSLTGMVMGLLLSGLIISKYKPAPGKLLMWNVIIGFLSIGGQVSYLFIYCGDTASLMVDGKLDLAMDCNMNCSCAHVSYSPVCHVESDTTYFSPCHAGCYNWDSENKIYSNCTCLGGSGIWTNNQSTTTILPPTQPTTTLSSQASSILDVLTPGACLKGCETAFWTFAIAAMTINWFASSGRIGNILVNYRAVAVEDKSFAQGLGLMLLSLFALIPGPIIFGRIIDSTCLVWTMQCGQNGNCQLYDQERFRYMVNLSAVTFTSFGIFFDILVWYYGRSLDFYGEREAAELKRKNKQVTPLMSRAT
ncbi:solute carrier organic anion transporter family member 74D [Episyrphus balteatus]|uniref:solute carrier organic anion transporter family member 74D n=1 Tax=Episyrphus balteatus TaxID=286459 RepID=UPI002486716F|nr:solute carrier organic anion transporter family member 74D [Episyrphus balteatus]